METVRKSLTYTFFGSVGIAVLCAFLLLCLVDYRHVEIDDPLFWGITYPMIAATILAVLTALACGVVSVIDTRNHNRNSIYKRTIWN